MEHAADIMYAEDNSVDELFADFNEILLDDLPQSSKWKLP